jgi:hypothetical protein
MLRGVLVILSVSIVLIGQVFAEPTVEFEGRYWVTDLQAETRVTTGTLMGTNIDLEDDLGVKDEDFPEARFSWYTGPNSEIRLAYTQVSYSGDRILGMAISFDGQIYNSGTQVNTDLDIHYARLGWAWEFINMFDDTLKIGSLLDAKYFLFDVSLDASSQAVKESERFKVALPTIGAVMDYSPIEKINIFGEVSGLPSADYGHIFDAELGIKFFPVKNFTIICGYRVIDMELENDPNYGELRITGPFAGATFRF